MLLEDITNAILEINRGGSIVDDEKIDYRLIEMFVKNKRAIYAQLLIDGGKPIPEQMFQYIPIKLSVSTDEPGKVLTTTDKLPKMLSTRFGPAIQEVTSATRLLQYPFRVINNSYFRVAGEGKFNTRFVYVTYRNNALKFKSKDISFLQIVDGLIKVVLEDPEEAYTYDNNGVKVMFDQDVDDFPIDMQCFEYIKAEVVDKDLRTLIAGQSDTVNDASGTVKQ